MLQALLKPLRLQMDPVAVLAGITIGFMMPLQLVASDLTISPHPPIDHVYDPSRHEDFASFVDEEIPRTMIAGQSYTATVTFRNTGPHSWSTTDGYTVTADAPETSRGWDVTPVPLPHAVATDQEVAFTVPLTAPLPPGTYALQFSLKKGTKAFGGLSATVRVTVQ